MLKIGTSALIIASVAIICLLAYGYLRADRTSDSPSPTTSPVLNVQKDTPTPSPTNTPNTGQESTPAPLQSTSPTEDSLKYNEYQVSLDIDTKNRIVKGIEKVTAKNRLETPTDTLFFRLFLQAFRNPAERKGYQKPFYSNFEQKIYANGVDYGYMNIMGVTVNGEEAEYTCDDTILRIDLAEPLTPQATVEITMQFEAYIPRINHRTGANEKAMWLGNFLPVAAVRNNDGWHLDTYYPAGDPFFTNISNYTVKITAPPDCTIAATGEVINASVSEDKQILTYQAKMTRDFALAMGDYEVATLISGGFSVNFYYYSNLRNVNSILAAAADALAYCSEQIGSYPYETLNIVEAGLFISGGMEYPQIVFVDTDALMSERALTVVTHEVAHQLFYNVVGNDQIQSPWLDEMFCQYLQYAIRLTPEQLDANMQNEYAKLVNDLPAITPKSVLFGLNVYRTWGDYYRIQYVRPMLMLYALKNKMGDEMFGVFLKRYYVDFSFKSSTPQGFMQTAEAVYGKSLSQFFSAWLEAETLPPLSD